MCTTPSTRATRWLLLALVIVFATAAPRAQAPADSDADGLPDEWEVQFGVNPGRNYGNDGASGDPDRDGLTNLDELRIGTHPRGSFRSAFAEGATGAFFDLRLALFNPSATTPARVLLRFFTGTGAVYTHFRLLPPLSRSTIEPEVLPGLDAVTVATEIESDVLVVADRTMLWDDSHYGAHTESGTPGPSTVWYFAEGATHSGFSLFYCIQNPGSTAADLEVSYLLPAGDPVRKRYAVAARSRLTILVNDEDPRLAATNVSAVFVSDLPLVVERAMYLSRHGGRLFEAGSASAGMTAPSLEWFLAEGATGDLFDLFVLIANPGDEPAAVTITYLLPDGSSVVRTRQIAPESRYTVWVDGEDPRLAATAVSTVVRSTNGVPILVERAMWWPGPFPTWTEAHVAAGVTRAATRWALAEGEAGGPDATTTYMVAANLSDSSATVRVTLFFEDGGQASRQFSMAARSRLTVEASASFPESAGRRFAALVESVGPTPVDLVVERPMYMSPGGAMWTAGTDAAGTPLDGGVVPPGSVVPVVTLSSAGARASEFGPRAASLVAVRSSATDALTVPVAVLGSASRNDVESIARAIDFAPGQTTATIVVTPIDDSDPEPDETVVVSLASGPGYSLGPSTSVVVVITDDDSRPADATTPSQADASRWLDQAAFGPTWAAVEELRRKGYERWFDDQVRAPRSSFLGYLDAVSGETVGQAHLQEAWFTAAIAGPDQLRQRVANALLEILVVSQAGGLDHIALASYMDVLMRDAFGNFRTVLDEVTRHPAMGRYLNMLQNNKEDPRTGRSPNENYAREILQLFSIGLHRLNADGSAVVDAGGNPLPTYDQDVVEGFAKVFTGWTYWQATQPYRFYGVPADWRNPMVAVPANHSTGAKTLLDGVALAAGQSPERDLADALDVVFRHPNVGPFIGRQLIQRLVTSNPSPGYVARVAAAFNDNGAGVRGDLRAVVRAILFDDEARGIRAADSETYGHLREPMIRFVALMRAFDGRAPSGRFRITSLDGSMGQAPFRSPTVFNFFSPSYRKPGPIAEAGLVSPEFQIVSETTAISSTNTMRGLVFSGYGSGEHRIRLSLTTEQQLAHDPGALLDRLDTILFGGRLSPELRGIVHEAVAAIASTRPQARVQTAIHLLASSPEYLVQK